jgi:hypothetical protein
MRGNSGNSRAASSGSARSLGVPKHDPTRFEALAASRGLRGHKGAGCADEGPQTRYVAFGSPARGYPQVGSVK